MRLQQDAGGEIENELGEALREFRVSVHAWSEAALNRPRSAASAARRTAWRLMAGWALGSVLIAAGVSAGIWEHHHQQQARMTAARAAENARLMAEARNQQVRQSDEDLLAKVDSDIAREVPSAMEPLAQLMDGDEGR